MSTDCGLTSRTPTDRYMAHHVNLKIVSGQKNRIAPVRQAQADTIREGCRERGPGAAGRWVHRRVVRQNKDERKKHQKWKKRVGYNSKWMVKIIIYSFKRLPDKALRAVKPEYMMIDIATKITICDKTRDVMRKATGRGVYSAALRGPESAWWPDCPCCARSRIMKCCLAVSIP